MKCIIKRFIFGLLVVLHIVACSNDPNTRFSVFSNQPAPTFPVKDIYVTEDGINNPYVILGSVEYTLKSNFPSFSNQTDLQNQAIENLKHEAVARYGAGIDAIINVVFQEIPEQESYFPQNAIYVRGTAVAYKGDTKSYSKPKRKHKVKTSKSKSKSTTNAIRKSAPDEQEEPEITPSEMLK